MATISQPLLTCRQLIDLLAELDAGPGPVGNAHPRRCRVERRVLLTRGAWRDD